MSPVSVSWFLLLAAGLLEVGWAVGLKLSGGFTRLWPSVATGVSMIASLVLLGLALEHLPVGSAYAVWTGIGAVGAAIVGVVLLGESVTAWKAVSLSLIVLGIAGLKLGG
jgi:quaternary ammonium compound-resistance protein SugE